MEYNEEILKNIVVLNSNIKMTIEMISRVHNVDEKQLFMFAMSKLEDFYKSTHAHADVSTSSKCEYVFSKGTRQGYMCDAETDDGEYCDLHRPEPGKTYKKHIRLIINREIWYKVHPPTGFVVDNEQPLGIIGVANKPGLDTRGRTLTPKGFYTLTNEDEKVCKRWGFKIRKDWENVEPVIDEEEEEVEKIEPPNKVVVYTDGACPNNGKKGAIGGVGVWFGENDSRNVSERLPGEKQTNQRAEIYAAIRALEKLEGTTGVVEVCTDSMYVINAMTQWIAGWMLKKWKDVENADLFQKLQELSCKRTMIWTHVKGHSGIHGNEMADKLAVAGCKINDEEKVSPKKEEKSKKDESDTEEEHKKTKKSPKKTKKDESDVEEEPKKTKKSPKKAKKDESESEDEEPKKVKKSPKKAEKKDEKPVEKKKGEKSSLNELKEKLKSINLGAVSSKPDEKVKVSASAVKKSKKGIDVFYYKTEDDSIIVSSTSKDEDLEFLSEHFDGKKFELATEDVVPTHRVALPDARRKKKGIVKMPKRKSDDDDE